MSHLANHEVEQGRFAQADDILADALRFSEEREIPICNMWQRGVQARLRLFQGRWREAEQDALGVLASGDVPWAGCGRTSCSGCSPRGGTRLRRTRTSTSCGGWRRSSICPACSPRPPRRSPSRRGSAAARTPGSTHSLLAALVDVATTGGAQLRRWVRRSAAAGVQPVDAPPPASGRTSGTSRTSGRWPCGTTAPTDDLLAALALLDALDARAVAAVVRGRLRELGVAGVPRGRSPITRANPGGLTDRQLDVLALLVEGKSNADIAARLVISRKTADHHVSAILGKLDVRSRGEAVAAARRLGLPR